MKTAIKIVAVLVTLCAWQSAMGADGSSETAINRMSKPLEANVGLNNAGPAGLGLGVGYSVTPWLKAVGGYSEMTMTTSVSIDDSGNMTTGETKYESYMAGAQVSVPQWNVTPIAGLNVAHYSVTSTGGGDATFDNLKGSGTLLYTDMGVNWQAHSGFTTSAGVNIPLIGRSTAAAFVDVGWAWDIL